MTTDSGGWAPLQALVAATRVALDAFEVVLRRLDPPAFPTLREGLGPVRVRLDDALTAWQEAPLPEGLATLRAPLADAVTPLAAALASFLEPAPPALASGKVLEAMRQHARALEKLYPLRQVLPPIGATFSEPALDDRLESLDPEPRPEAQVGLLRAAGPADAEGRGGFSLYVPEWHDGKQAWPLVVALHGGFGAGEDFVFTWLREARSRGCLVLAPTSRGTTWSLDDPPLDTHAIFAMVEWVAERWPVDRARVLATGLSDGASFALLAGLAEGSPFTHLAPVSGVLHPTNFGNGNLDRARGRPIRLIHGARDWLFPVGLARAARDALTEAGADLVYREIADLSHTYPREENVGILGWLDARLAEARGPD